MTERRPGTRRWRQVAFVVFVLSAQAACTLFFVGDILTSVFGLRSTAISWRVRELLEIGAAIGLLLGLVLGAMAWRKAHVEARESQLHLRRAQSAFHQLVEDRFADWRLTRAERDVALFSIKGLSLGEIAALRGTSEGTIKAQTNAIYRKAGVSSRSQLLGIFIEDLVAGDGFEPSGDKPALDASGLADSTA